MNEQEQTLGGAGGARVETGQSSEVEELLDVIRDLLDFSRAGSFDEAPGEWDAWERAMGILRRYAPVPAGGTTTPEASPA